MDIHISAGSTVIAANTTNFGDLQGYIQDGTLLKAFGETMGIVSVTLIIGGLLGLVLGVVLWDADGEPV